MHKELYSPQVSINFVIVNSLCLNSGDYISITMANGATVIVINANKW